MQPLRILVVDDNADHRFLTKRALRRVENGEPIAVSVAEDGEAALAALREGPRPDLVLLDIKMPRLDGFGVLAALRDDAALRDLTVIMLTSSENAADQQRAQELGADDYVTKPLDPSEFADELARVIAKWRAASPAGS